MTGSVILGCATGLALIFSTYAARMLRRVYIEFREAERLARGEAAPELHFVGARSAMSRQRLQAYAANDNSPIVPMAVTGTDVSSTAH